MIFTLGTNLFSAPEITVIGGKEVDLGEYPAKDCKEVKFTIQNTGDEVLKILKVRKTCGCAEATADKVDVAPGEKTVITAVILPNSIFVPYEIKIYVESNAPEARLVLFKVKGSAVPLLKLFPSDKIYVKRIMKGSIWAQVISFKAMQKGIELEEPVVESNYPVELKIVQGELSNPVNLKYDCSIKVEKVVGDLMCRIKFPVTKPVGWKSVNIMIFGHIGNSFTAIPTRFKLSTEKSIPIKKEFILRIIDPNEIDPSKVKWMIPKGVSGVEFKLSGVNSSTIKVSAVFDQSFLDSLKVKKKIVIKFEYPDAQPAIVIVK